MLSAIAKLLQDDQSDCRILVCTPSHTAADVVTLRLGKMMASMYQRQEIKSRDTSHGARSDSLDDKNKSLVRRHLFRLLDADRPVEALPVAVLSYCRQDESGTFCLPQAPELFQFRVIVCTCVDAHFLYRVGLTNQQLRLRRQDFRDVLLQQCGPVNLKMQGMAGVDVPHFTHLLVDEAAQATEPELLIPLSVVVDPDPASSARKVEIALVGDPRQLSPNVYSDAAAAGGLGRSWMERLLLRPVIALGGGRNHMLGLDLANMEDWLHAAMRENLSVFLTQNYRGHPSFLMVPSPLFYYDKLQSVYTNEKDNNFWCTVLRWIECLSKPVELHSSEENASLSLRQRKRFDWPIHFVGVLGKDSSVTLHSGFASNSWCNEAEAKVVLDIVVALSEKNVPTQSIGVMAPFRGQVALIRNLLRDKNLGAINVGIVEDYQAVERDVIVLSLTRSTKLMLAHDMKRRIGVFGQAKRSNVALTRAENLFIVVSLHFNH